MCFWTKTRLTNIPVAPESRRVEVETECREVVVWSSTFMLRARVDLDRTHMDGGGTAGGSGGMDSCFTLDASLLSDVPRNGCDSAGYLQRECFLLSNRGAPLTGCGLKSCDSFALLLAGSMSPVAPSPFVASPLTAILTASVIAWMVSGDRGSVLCTCCTWGSGQFQVMCPGLLQL